MADDTRAEARVPCPLRAAARRVPQAPALIGPERTWSYAALEARVAVLAAHVRRAGWAEGAHVALHLPRSAAHVLLLWALWRAGAVACPLSTRTPPARLDEHVRAARAHVLLTDDAEARAAAAMPTVSVRALLHEAAEGAAAASAREEEGSTWAEAKNTWTESTWALERPATVVFTSGSTGAPRAALHSLGNHYWSAQGSNANIALAPGDRWLLSLPLYHVGGLAILHRCALAGAAVVVPDPRQPLGEALRRHRITHVSLVETQLRRLLAAEGEAAATLRAVLVGGSAVAPDLIDAAHGRGLPLHTSYGMTEMASQVTTTPPGASRAALHTSGHVLPHRELSVGEGDAVAGAEGEIRVRGRTLFLGYLAPDGTPHRPLDGEGWLRTGDVGALDAAGRLHVRGRIDNMFVSGGENVHPEETEAALGRLEGVAQAVVVPVPDAEFGRRPVAFVRMAGEHVRLGGEQAGAAGEALREALETRLPRFKIPVAFYAWPEDEARSLKLDRAFFAARARRLHDEAQGA